MTPEVLMRGKTTEFAPMLVPGKSVILQQGQDIDEFYLKY